LTFVEGSELVNWRRYVKIQNDHSTITLQWTIIIEQQEDWWEIENGSPRSGTLDPGESERVFICIDRTGKEDGEYPGKFKVRATGPGYSRTEEVNFIMKVGGEEPVVPDGILYEPNKPTLIPFADDRSTPVCSQSLRVVNKHATTSFNWELKINFQDDWWQISPESPRRGTLNPGQSTTIDITVDRLNKDNGEHWGHFKLHFSNREFRDSVLVALLMEVGEPDSSGPRLININTNSSTNPDRLILTFDKYLDMSRAYKTSNFIITPSITVNSVSVQQNKIHLKTKYHNYATKYVINIPQIVDMQNRTSVDVSGEYQFYHCCAGIDLKVTGASGSYEWDVALPDKRIYTDQTFSLGQIPTDLYGVAMLRTSQRDALQKDLSISFTAGCNDIRVLLAGDPRQSGLWDNEWIKNDYTKLSRQLLVDGIPGVTCFDLYESNGTFLSEQVITLFQNGALIKDDLMYFVLVRGIKNVSGKIDYYATSSGISDVTLNLPTNILGAQSVTIDSMFEFPELTAYSNLFITPGKTGDITRTTILMHDAWLAAQIASEKLSNPTAEQLMAADVDSSGKVTMADAESIADQVVGLNSNLKNQTGNWRFFPGARFYAPLLENLADQNFTAMVLGDVDGNWQPLNSRNQLNLAKMIDSTETVNHIWIPEIVVASTETTVVVPIVVTENLSGQGITSYTAELEWDQYVMKNPHISRIGTLTTDWGDQNYYQNDKTPGKVIFGQFSTVSVLEGSGVLFKLHFDITGKPGDSSRIHLNLLALNNSEPALLDNRLRINHPPDCEPLTLSPMGPVDDDSLNAAYRYHDTDGDAEKQTQIQWYKNGIEQPEFNNSFTIPPSATQPGEQWYFAVTPNDGIESGKTKQSPVVTIYYPVRAQMNVFPIFGKPDSPVQFLNYTTDNSLQFRWNFGDGFSINLSGTEHPLVHTYRTPGCYTVSLRAAGNAGVDSVVYPQLICIDENATELLLINAGDTRPDRGWIKAIDHNVITAAGNVLTTLMNGWAKFAFKNDEIREITQIRLKRSNYYSTSAPGRKVTKFEIQGAIDSTDFQPIISEQLDTDDWIIFPIKSASPIRYLLLRLITTVDSQPDSCEFGEIQVFSKPVNTAIEEKIGYLKPATFRIINNYPNPFNNSTIIVYDIKETARISFSIYNLQGQLVRELKNEIQEPGTYQLKWDGTDEKGLIVVNGVYFCRMRISNKQNDFYLPTHKILILK